MTLVAAAVVVKGNVQGVGYRYFCYQKALSFGVTGWVCNDPEGSVSLLLEGEKEVLVDLVELLREGPASSRVDDVEIEWRDYSQTMKTFEMRF